MSLAGSNRKPALTAAARRIAFSRQTADKLKEESWQERAWAVYGNLPEVFYMTRYRSDVASKIEYFVATQDEPGSDPDFDEGGAGTKVLESEGGPSLLRRIVSEMIVHWDIPGEAYLTRFDEAPLWRVLSTQELKKHGTRFAWGDETNNLGSIESDQVFRVWDPHPRFHWQADSPTRHVLDNAEELILLTREAKASSMSRVSAGLFVLPDSIDLSPFADDEDGTPDDVARWLVDVLAKPISDPGSSSSVVPAVMTMHGDDIAKIRHITFARDWEINLELRRELLRSVAAGLDLPPEILTGMADLNHWTAWQVSEQAVSQHVLPSVDAILDSLTINWFRPLLEASGVNPEGYVLWRDPSPATVSPDQSDVAIRMYEQDAISGEALRRVTNFDEEDAPTPEELEDKTARRSASTQGVPTDGPPVQSAIDPDDALRFFELLDRNPRLADLLQQAFVKEGDPPLARAAVTAATRRRIVATELAEIDAEILVWVQDQADLEIERLTKLALSAAVDPLDESLLTGLASKLDAKIAEAQEAARSWLTRTLGREPSDDGESLARNQGVQVIIAGILEAVRRKLFTPGGAPDPIETGRIGNISTPTQAIRHGLSLAGGGPAVYEDGKAAELIGNGQHVHDELAEDGFFQDGYEWKYGHPANTFEPHMRLDGKQFTSWDDPQLAVNFGDSWLRRSHYAPGDHKGCCCAFIQVIVQRLEIGEGLDAVPSTPGPRAAIDSVDDLQAWAAAKGYKLNIGNDIDWERHRTGIQQAVRAIDDMTERYSVLSGRWDQHPMPFLSGKDRGLTEVTFGGPRGTAIGAGADVKLWESRTTSQMRIFQLVDERIAPAHASGWITTSNVYDMIVHEMGHVMEGAMWRAPKITDVGNFAKVIRDARRTVWKAGRTYDSVQIRTDVSGYAATDDSSEFFAEIFATRNSPSVWSSLSPEAAARVNQFADLVNQQAREIWGLTEDVI